MRSPGASARPRPGYRGFSVEFGPEVTLEEDLGRRDLTINAMARQSDGTLVDPHGGKRDLDARLLRHVSDAFVEDPVRVLRVARFAARFAPLGFRVAPDTMALMKRMVLDDEVDALVAERVWQESEKALREPAPGAFFRVLRECGALARIYPEIDALFGVPQPARWHPEIDTGVHTLMVLDQAVDPERRFARCGSRRWCTTSARPRRRRPSGRATTVMKSAASSLIEALAARLKVPGDYRDLAVIVARYHGIVHRAFELRPRTVLEFMERSDAFRRPERFARALLACEADSRGRAGLEDNALSAARIPARGARCGGIDQAGAGGACRPLRGRDRASSCSRRRLEAVTAVRARY